MTCVSDVLLQPLIDLLRARSAQEAGVVFLCHVFKTDSSSVVGTCRTTFLLYPSETELLISESKPDIR